MILRISLLKPTVLVARSILFVTVAFLSISGSPAQTANSPPLREDSVVLPASVPDPFESFNRSEEHTSELQSHLNLVCRLLLEKKKHTSNKKRKTNTVPYQ